MSDKKQSTSKRNTQPNIIIINCDDLGYGDLPPYDNTVMNTPHIDQLAQGGVKFTSFYACNSLCTPSRFGLLTGRYPERAGLGWVLGAKRAGHRPPIDSRVEDLWGRFRWEVAKFLTRLGLMDYNNEPKPRGIPEQEVTIAKALKNVGYKTLSLIHI